MDNENKKTTYEFGVMSSKYSLISKDEKIAHICMCIYIGSPLPIAIYKPFNKLIKPTDILKDNYDMAEKNRHEVLECFESIKRIENGTNKTKKGY